MASRKPLDAVEVDGKTYAGVESSHLHAGYIGHPVIFNWRFPSSDVKAVVTGELRQIYHNSAETVLNLTAPDSDTADLTEFTLVAGDTVLVPWETAAENA
ncbi:hypothetical protein [Nocardia phage KYD2]|nr:hypothetical protein [Nocardia phage KYD2]